MAELVYSYRHAVVFVLGIIALIALIIGVKKVYNLVMHGNILSLLPAVLNLGICGGLGWLWFNPPESFLRYKRENTTKEVVVKVTKEATKVFDDVSFLEKKDSTGAKKPTPVLITKSGQHVAIPLRKFEEVKETYHKGDTVYVFMGELVSDPENFFKHFL